MVCRITEAAASKAVAANVYHHMGSIAAVAFEAAAGDVQQALQSPGGHGAPAQAVERRRESEGSPCRRLRGIVVLVLKPGSGAGS